MLQKDENVALLAISVDNAEMTNRFATKIARDGKGEPEFPMLSDPGHKIIDAYGLVDTHYLGGENEGIPHPAIYILDEKRKVLWKRIESNYRIRPTVAEVRLALDNAKKVRMRIKK